MAGYLNKIVLVTTMSLLSFGVTNTPTQASSLFLGKYGYLGQNLDVVKLAAGGQLPSNFLASNQLSIWRKPQYLKEQLAEPVKSFELAVKVNQKVKQYYQIFLATSEEAKLIASEKVSPFSTVDQINQDIQARYQGLIEEDTEMMSALAARKLLMSENNIIAQEARRDANLQHSIAMQNSEGILDGIGGGQKEVINFPLLIGILLILATILSPIFLAVGKIIEEEVVENLQEKYGKPKVPEKAVELHDKLFKEITTLANIVLNLADNKFGTKEFILYLNIKEQIEKGIREYKTLGESIKYLEVAIAAQGSYLKLESTELRFRSRKQQEFYGFVAETISENLDRNIFNDKVKKKLSEIIPLLNSEEGRSALQAYLKEVNEISQHNLGLKLLALFKKYQLADFTILKTVSNIVQQLEGQDLLKPKNLTVLILENYEIFEKLAPIIGVSESEHSPETYTKMMQYMGLVNRHDKSYQEFMKLLTTLKKWEKLYKSLSLVREEYSDQEYRIPEQFTKKLPGLEVYNKYKKYFESQCFK